MAISGLGFACRPHIPLRPPMFYCVGKARYGAVAAIDILDEPEPAVKRTTYSSGASAASGGEVEGGKKPPAWKKLNSEGLGVSTSMIAKPTRRVLNALKKKGYEVYLVGGCVRDFILKRTPKDFDIITSAELKEVVRAFSCCQIVGRRFPICHVHIDDTIVEVSSFSTTGRTFRGGWNNEFLNPVDCEDKDFVRWRNCMRRDFTINGLMFDPYARIVYDYVGGLEDIRKAKVRTVIPASASFQEDCARILRAVRIAARLGFRLSKDTSRFVKNLSGSVSRLDKTRIMMEMNYMLAYGSAEASLRLLWKFGLLEILLPIQASYLVQNGFRRRDTRSNMLLSLFSHLDKLVAPDKPCHSSLCNLVCCSSWVFQLPPISIQQHRLRPIESSSRTCLEQTARSVEVNQSTGFQNFRVGILAFHKALSDSPRDPMVVATFCLAVHNGGDTSEAVKIAKRITKPHDKSYHELLEPQRLDSRGLVNEVMNLAASVKQELSRMTDEYYVSKAMAKYPKAPYSDMVFIPLALYLRVRRIFECVGEGREGGFVAKQGRKINHELLSMGSLPEVRHTFARVVFDAVYPLNQRY